MSAFHEITVDSTIGHARVLPAAISHALTHYTATQPVSAAIALEVMPLVLADIIREGSWTYSPMNADGFPLRFDFSSACDALVFTTEVAGPGLQPVQRLALAAELCERLGARPETPVLSALAALQTDGDLRFGAWLRACYAEPEPAVSLYAETPAVAQEQAQQPLIEVFGVQELFPQAEVGHGRIGYEIDTGELEFVFCVRSAAPWHMERLFQIVGFGERFAELSQAVGTLAGAALDDVMRTTACEFSVTLDSANRALRASLAFDANAVLGSDARVRMVLLRLAHNCGWELGAYPALSASLDRRRQPTNFHGPLEFVLENDRELQICFSLRPPG